MVALTVGKKLRDKREKRKLNDITNEQENKPLKIQVNKKSFNVQSPSTSAKSSLPIITNKNIHRLQTRLDICLSTNTTYATSELLEKYNEIQKMRRKSGNLEMIEGAKELFCNLINLEKDKFIDNIAAAEYTDSAFNRFIKFSMIDFGVNTLRIPSIPVNDERTMFVEIIVQLWKYFGSITGLLSFKWCERKDKEAATAIFFANQEKSDDTLLNGIGFSSTNTATIVVE